jgi:hypothetical protein
VPAAPPPVAAPAAEVRPATIVLPGSLVVDLPRNVSTLAPEDPPLQELLAAAKSGDLIVTNSLSHSVGPGPVEITWTAWEGAPGASKPAATRTATITVRAASTAVVTASHEKPQAATAAVPETEMGKIAAPEQSDHMEPGRKAEGTVLFTLGDLLYSVPNLIGRLRQ